MELTLEEYIAKYGTHTPHPSFLEMIGQITLIAVGVIVFTALITFLINHWSVIKQIAKPEQIERKSRH